MPNPTFSDEYSRLTAFLVEMRNAAGVTQIELAGRLNRPQSFVSKYERGERRIDVVEFAQIIEALSGNPVAAFTDCYSRWRGA